MGYDASSDATAWRDVVGRRLAALVCGLAVVAMITVADELGVSPSGGGWTIGFGGMAALLGLAVRRSFPLRWRAVTVVAATLIAASLGYARFGVTTGPALALVIAVVAAGLLLGRRAMYLTLAIASAAVLVVGTLMVRGHLAPPTAVDVSPLLAKVWLRTSIFTLLVVFLLAALVTWVVERIEVTAARAEAETARRHDGERKALAAQQAELVGQVAAGLAHDVNNHLAVIAMWTSVLLTSRAEEDIEEAAVEIDQAIRQATSLTRRVLVLGRRGIQTPKPRSLPALVAEQTTTLQRVLKPNIALEVVPATADAWCFADDAQLHQVVLNLAMNARDAMASGGTVVVRTGACERRGAATVFLTVEDTGVGMSAEVLARATEPFFTTRAPGKGSGLGLAAVAAVARQSDGELVIESTPGAGTRVTLYLPALTPPAGEAAAPPVPPPLALGARILLVDDSPALVQIVRRTLLAAGCTVVVAADGDEAVRRVEEGPFDLLCSDVVMPGRPTREVIAVFEARNPGAPVLLCSGYVDEELVRRGIEAGRYRFLAKPFSPDQLLAAVAMLLAGAPSATSATAR